jgi:hypothetical protein
MKSNANDASVKLETIAGVERGSAGREPGAKTIAPRRLNTFCQSLMMLSW